MSPRRPHRDKHKGHFSVGALLCFIEGSVWPCAHLTRSGPFVGSILSTILSLLLLLLLVVVVVVLAKHLMAPGGWEPGSFTLNSSQVQTLMSTDVRTPFLGWDPLSSPSIHTSSLLNPAEFADIIRSHVKNTVSFCSAIYLFVPYNILASKANIFIELVFLR